MRPDFVVLGVAHADGVVLYASTELNEAEISEEIDRYDFEHPGDLFRVSDLFRRFEFRGTMRTFVMASGADYAEAMRNLTGHFERDDQGSPFRSAPRAAVDTGRRELDSGRPAGP